MTYVIKHGLLIGQDRVVKADILVSRSSIQLIAPVIRPEDVPPDTRIIDASGCFVLPGLIDAHTHYHLESRGTVTADSFPEGSRAAAFGGVTTVIDFADHPKTLSLKESSEERISQMSRGMAVDFALHQGVYRMHDGIDRELKELSASGVTAVKVFTTYRDAGYLMEPESLRELFRLCRKHHLLVTVHAEDDRIIEQCARRYAREICPPGLHPELRPAEAEARAVEYVTGLARQMDMPVYIVHLSSSAGLETVRRARRQGTAVAVETTPHYLQLDRTCLELQDGELYLMTPPLRRPEDNRELWSAVASNEISVIATDHCAFTPEQKRQSSDCRTILPGIPGTEELLPLVHTFGVGTGQISMQQLISLLSEAPARHFGLYPKKGVIREGSDADLVIFDPEPEWTITNGSQHSSAGYTPYAGTDVRGAVRMTMRRGEIIMEDGHFLGDAGSGEFQHSGVSDLYR